MNKWDIPEGPCLECGKNYSHCICEYFNIGSTEKYERTLERNKKRVQPERATLEEK